MFELKLTGCGLALALLAGCGDPITLDDETGSEPGTSAEDTTSDGATTDATINTTATTLDDTSTTNPTGTDPTATTDADADTSTGGYDPGSLGNDHGVVLVEFQRHASATEDPFVGTAQIEVTLGYLGCLFDFYENNPEYQQQGREGQIIFGDALGPGLCEPLTPETIECSALSIFQSLDVAAFLSVIYDVSGPIEGRRLRFGPLPTAALTLCGDGELPAVIVVTGSVIRGFDAAGDVIWQTVSFFPHQAATDQSAPITVEVAPPR